MAATPDRDHSRRYLAVAAMSENLPVAPAQYSQRSEQEFRNRLEQRDDNTHKRDRHLEGVRGTGIILTDTATGGRYLIEVTSGALALTAL